LVFETGRVLWKVGTKEESLIFIGREFQTEVASKQKSRSTSGSGKDMMAGGTQSVSGSKNISGAVVMIRWNGCWNMMKYP